MTDLRNTTASHVLERYFDDVAQGNEGDAEIQELTLEGTVLHYKVKIRHHQVATIRVPFNGKKNIDVYSLTTYAEGNIDVINPSPDDQKVCVDTPFGQMCITLTEIISLVATLV
ncbi:MAG: hypothetical protein WCK96_15945 [Methylococcales bacterium]